MKPIKTLRLLGMFFPAWLMAQTPTPQTLTLPWVQEQAAANYPLVRQRALHRQSSTLRLDNLKTSFLPQLQFSAQATYQSAVTEVPVKIPAFEPIPLSKDQYRALMDVQQLIYDGGSLNQQTRVQYWNDRVEDEKIEVELQKLRELINQVYFAALFAEEQGKLIALTDKDLDAGVSRVSAQVAQGTAYRSALASLQSEKLRNAQKRLEWEASKRGLLDVLELYTGMRFGSALMLTWPDERHGQLPETVTRSELTLIHLQDTLLREQQRMIDVRNRPRLSAFVQGGYGRPGLDMLKNEFEPFYIAGLRVHWGISSLYTSKRDRSLMDLQRNMLGVQEDYFLLQVGAKLKQQAAEVQKWKQMIPMDEEIIALREQVRASAQAQLAEGVATASDYIREVNAADQARLQWLLHRLMWIQSVEQYRTMAGTYSIN